MRLTDRSVFQVTKALRDLAPHIAPPTANPTPLGLFSFAITTALLMTQTTELTGSSKSSQDRTENLVWGVAIFTGGLIQLLAGLCEGKRNNVFGFTAFCSYSGYFHLCSHLILRERAELGASKRLSLLCALHLLFSYILVFH